MVVGGIRTQAGGMGINIRPFLAADRAPVHAALIACNAFSDEEVRVALEMVDAGMDGDYTLLAADTGDVALAYACIGRAPLTVGTWYVYWICVHPLAQRAGLGRALQARIEEFATECGGRRLVLETSGRADYERTRRFYDAAGFDVVGRIPDFYGPNDDCVVYWKPLGVMTR